MRSGPASAENAAGPVAPTTNGGAKWTPPTYHTRPTSSSAPEQYLTVTLAALEGLADRCRSNRMDCSELLPDLDALSYFVFQGSQYWNKVLEASFAERAARRRGEG